MRRDRTRPEAMVRTRSRCSPAGGVAAQSDEPPATEDNRCPPIAEAVRVIAEGILLVDGRGVVLYCNQSASDLLGEDVDQIIGSCRPNLLQEWGELRTVAADEPLVLETRARDLRWNDDVIAVVSVHDVSRHRAQEAHLAALAADQRALMAATAHELRSPLAAIALTAETLRAMPRRRAGALLADHLDRIIGESRGLARHVRELQLAFDEDGPTAIAPPTDVHLASVMLSGVAGRPHWEGLFVDCAAKLTVRGDAAKVWLMLSNCIDNAFRHGTPPVAVRCRANGSRTEIHVADSGPGVPEAFVDRLFEPYMTAPSKGFSLEGGGIGLCLVRRLAQSEGGDCWYEGDGPDGPRFVISLPAGSQPGE